MPSAAARSWRAAVAATAAIRCGQPSETPSGRHAHRGIESALGALDVAQRVARQSHEGPERGPDEGGLVVALRRRARLEMRYGRLDDLRVLPFPLKRQGALERVQRRIHLGAAGASLAAGGRAGGRSGWSDPWSGAGGGGRVRPRDESRDAASDAARAPCRTLEAGSPGAVSGVRRRRPLRRLPRRGGSRGRSPTRRGRRSRAGGGRRGPGPAPRRAGCAAAAARSATSPSSSVTLTLPS